MSTYTICFSPTGGTKKVLDIMNRKMKSDVEIDISKKEFDIPNFNHSDVCIIGVPSYGGRVPQIALERLKLMKGNHAKAVLVISYGNRAYDDTVLELQKEMESVGFDVIAAIAAVTEHSIMRQFGAGRPDAEDQAELEAFAEKIHDKYMKLQNLGESESLSNVEKSETAGVAGKSVVSEGIKVPGNEPYQKYGGVPLKPKAGKQCDQCGVCASLCPVGAIPKENPSVTNGELCISCMRCIGVCPKKARKLNGLLVFVASKGMKKVCSGRKKNELFI